MNAAIDYRNLPPDAAADAYAESLSYLDARDAAVTNAAETLYQALLNDPMAIMELVGNSDNRTAEAIGHALISCMKGVSGGTEALAVVSLIGGTLEAIAMRQVKQQAEHKVKEAA